MLGLAQIVAGLTRERGRLCLALVSFEVAPSTTSDFEPDRAVRLGFEFASTFSSTSGAAVSADLGASAALKYDIEAFFPSRTHAPWGELTSLSLCTDYQSRRLATRIAAGSKGSPAQFPYTLNGTAMAVPRVMAAVLEHGWDAESGVVRLPECLWGFMGKREIGPAVRK